MAESAPNPPIVGQKPTEEFWITAATNLTPAKSFERFDSHGKYIFGFATTFSVALTGLGLFGTPAVALGGNPLFAIPVALFCTSLALSMLGLTPKLDSVYFGDIPSIRGYYQQAIRRRGRCIRWAGIFFAVSLFSTATLVGLSLYSGPPTEIFGVSFYSGPSVDGKVSLQLMGEPKTRELSATVDYEGLPPTGEIWTKIVGRRTEGGQIVEDTLFEEKGSIKQSEKSSVTTKITNVQGYTEFVLTPRVTSKGKTLYEKQFAPDGKFEKPVSKVDAKVSLQLTGKPGARDLSATVDYDGLPAIGEIVTKIVGKRRKGEQIVEESLFEDVSLIKEAGESSVKTKVEKIHDYGKFSLSTEVKSRGILLYGRRVVINRTSENVTAHDSLKDVLGKGRMLAAIRVTWNI